MKTLHWYFPWETALHLYNMTGRGEKLQQLHCYHPFSDSLDIYLTKNHYENYSPKMVPIAKIWGSGSWTITNPSVIWLPRRQPTSPSRTSQLQAPLLDRSVDSYTVPGGCARLDIRPKRISNLAKSLHNIRLSCPIVLKFCTAPGSINAVLCAKFHNAGGNWERSYDQTRFRFEMGFGWISYTAQPPWPGGCRTVSGVWEMPPIR